MSLHITDDEIISSVTEHHAHRTTEGWEVSWLPDRVLDRNSAITAMLLAEIYAEDPPPWDKIWVHAAGWEKELGIEDGKGFR